jgi:VanZ family protein
MRTSTSRYALILTGVTVIIIYASLYPFDFSHQATTIDALKDLLSTWRSIYSWGNVIGNALLYFPFGFCLVRALPAGSGLVRVLLGGLAGFTLCAGLEVAQIHDRNRDPSMSDVYANTAGALAGSLGGLIALHGAGRNARFERHPFSSLLLLCWLGSRLFPYRPALRPLARISAIPLDELFRNFANWLAVAVLLEAVFGNARSRWVLPCLVVVTVAARVVIVGRSAVFRGGRGRRGRCLDLAVAIAFGEPLHRRGRGVCGKRDHAGTGTLQV